MKTDRSILGICGCLLITLLLSACYENIPAVARSFSQATLPQKTYHLSLPLVYRTTAFVVAWNRPAFDICNIPSINDMQTWWTNSPYFIVNLYIGGISRLCSNSQLDSHWVSVVHSRGWAFIPTWVGPQAPCNNFHHPMDPNPAISYQQGRSEAEAASFAAYQLGLTQNNLAGTIIYYDMEAYGGGKAPVECRNAVNSFVDGWVERLHELGNKAGVYGGACSSNVTDWATIPHIPDDVWLASWYTDQFDPNATVWDVPCVPSNLWVNHRRIRQYAGDHSETWGGLSLSGIDSDIADGEVVSPTRMITGTLPTPTPTGMPPTPTPTLTGTLPFPTPTATGTLPTPTPTAASIATNMSKLEAFQLIAREQGWVMVNRHLYRTDDGGKTWLDITPSTLPNIIILMAYFLEPQQGWLIVSSGSSLLLLQTTNGGQNWQMMPSSGFPPEYAEAIWKPISIQFINTQMGWVTFKLATSSNFSVGMLFKTTDGGINWKQLNLPIGGPVHFVTSEIGWMAGGATGNELYQTKDGGLTWEPVPGGGQPWGPAPHPTNLPIGSVAQDFTAPDYGWVKTVNGECRSGKLNCELHTALWKTSDGGKTWTTITLPHP